MTAPTITTPGGLDQQGRAVAPVTIGGVTLPAGSTPAERQAAIIKANIQPHQGGIGHTSETMAELARQAAKAPPSPAALEAANKPQPRTEEQMRDAGLVARPDLGGRFIGKGEYDTEAHQLLEAKYLMLVKPLIGKSDESSVAARERFKSLYESGLKQLAEGRQLTAKEMARMQKELGMVTTLTPKDKAPKPAEPAEPTTPTAEPGSYQQHVDAEGFVGIEHLTLDDTSGYSIPRFVSDQSIDVSVLGRLKIARAAGLTQEMVDAFFREDAVKNGWVKA